MQPDLDACQYLGWVRTEYSASSPAMLPRPRERLQCFHMQGTALLLHCLIPSPPQPPHVAHPASSSALKIAVQFPRSTRRRASQPASQTRPRSSPSLIQDPSFSKPTSDIRDVHDSILARGRLEGKLVMHRLRARKKSRVVYVPLFCMEEYKACQMQGSLHCNP